MTEQTYSDSELDHYRHAFRDAAKGKGTTHVPVKDGQAGKVADMLDDLAERKRGSHCRACGEPAVGRYCREHA